MQAEILYMDADMIAAAKPAGMASQPDRSIGMDLVNWLKNELARREGSPGQVLVVHRLDRPVAGVLVYARNQKAAAALSAQLTDGRMKKEYLAVLTGRPDGQPLAQEDAPDGRQWYRLETLMEAEERKNRSRTSAQKGKKAVLFYCVLAEKETAEGLLTLVQIRLQTGRHHQIRVQMASAGAPLWGDTKYNPAFTGKRGWYDLALFARSLTCRHPRTGKDMVFAIPAGESITAHFADADRAADRIG
jgi:23S rRNA pseudouridine1911/1915/1917 synthase